MPPAVVSHFPKSADRLAFICRTLSGSVDASVVTGARSGRGDQDFQPLGLPVASGWNSGLGIRLGAAVRLRPQATPGADTANKRDTTREGKWSSLANPI